LATWSAVALAGFQRLHHLDAARRLELALRDRHDVDAPNKGPDEAPPPLSANGQNESQHAPARAGFQNLQRGGYES
jgi:hypothetical protein